MVPLNNSTKVLKLNTGALIPQLGFGTWRSTEEEAYNAVLEALKLGYRHIDSAAIYMNEIPVGKAIKDSGVPREEIFVTTKLWGTQHRDPAAALTQSLERLGLDYVDLYLIHWPLPFEAISNGGDYPFMSVPSAPDGTAAIDEDWDFIKTWEKMQELPSSGKTKAVGVSNFSVKNMKDLLAAPTTKLTPAAIQVEAHPLLPQNELIKFAKEHDILLEAYSPLGSENSPLLKDASLKAIADSYGVSVAQLLINWALKRNFVVLPKSINKDRIASNFKEFELKDEDFAKLNAIAEGGEQRLIHPGWKSKTLTLFE
jgi:glycerol 2-dehydrogenase (NADP+)